MSEQALLPSPNWFLSTVAACSSDGTLAYGSRNGIVVVKSIKEKEGSASTLDFETIPNAHREKVIAMSFSSRNLPDSCLPPFPLASASEDGMIIIWNLESLEILQRHREHKEKVNCIDWSRAGELLLVSADERGKVVVWDLAANTCRPLQLLTGSRLSPQAIACSPASQDVVAAGCKDGLVCLLNIKGQGQLVSKLRGHDKSVVALSWCPWVEGAGDDSAPLLASGGLDQELHIWQPKTGLSVKTIQLPAKQLGTTFKARSETSKGNVVSWVPLVWLKPSLLLTGSSSSELLAWNPQAEKPTARLIHSEHLRGLSCIAAQPCKNASSDWRAPEEAPVVWTMAQDRRLVHSVLVLPVPSGDEPAAKSLVFPTLGGFVYCLASCPFAPGRVAVGVGDETIRVWNMSDTTCINASIIWQRIKGKVMALAWHPEKEGILAFGTSDGRVGFCNVSNPNKEPVVFRQFHRSTVYRVAWGPPAYIKDSDPPTADQVLYACDETTSVYYVMAEPQKGPILVKPIIQACNPAIKAEVQHKELSWKSDFSLLAIGLDDGCIQLFSTPHLRCIHTLLAHKKSVYYLMWHPLCTATDENEAPQRHWLASASVDQTIYVFDITPLVPDEEEKEWKIVPLPIEPFTELKHGGKVVCLCWNPHISGQLASSSYDKSIKVWDVMHQEVTACYFRHSGCVLACCWSMLDPDVMISGSADFTVRTWCISTSLPDSQPLRRDKPRLCPEEGDVQVVIKSPKVISQQADTKASKEHVKDPKSGVSSDKERVQSGGQEIKKVARVNLFPVSGPASNKKECALLCCEELMRAKGILALPSEPDDQSKTVETLETLEANETGTTVTGKKQENVMVPGEAGDTAIKFEEASVDIAKETVNYAGDANDKVAADVTPDKKITEDTIETHIKEVNTENKMIPNLNDALKTEPKSDKIVPLTVEKLPNIGYFTSQENMLAMLDADGDALKVSGNHKGSHSLELWRGNLHETLKTAAQTKHLNDWLVSLAPSVSHKVWLEMCGVYAEQLVQEGDYIKASSYLLVCHKVLEAVTLLKSHKLFREAIAICRCRLSSDDSVTKDTIYQWGKASLSQGSYELAAQCFISAGDYKEAALVLSKRRDPKMWKLGAILAKEAGDEAMCMSLASECFYSSLQDENWSAAKEIMKEHPSLSSLQVLLETHQLVCGLAKEELPNEEALMSMWRDDIKHEDSLLVRLNELCEQAGQENLHAKLLVFLPSTRMQPESRKELLLQLSKLLVLAAAAHREGIDDWERLVVEALYVSYRRGLLCVKERPLLSLLWWLRCPVLEKQAHSESAFKCAAMLDCLTRENPDTIALLSKFKSVLLDEDCAKYSRLTVQITEKEKQVAAAQATKKDTEKAQAALTESRNAKEALEKDRVAFPNPLIIYCKLQGFLEYFKEKETMEANDLAEWRKDMAAFRLKLEK